MKPSTISRRSFRVSGDEQIFFPRTKIFLFRIVQEGTQ